MTPDLPPACELAKLDEEMMLAAWPNCAVADCEYKAYVPVSNCCWFHMNGLTPPPFEEYMARDAT